MAKFDDTQVIYGLTAVQSTSLSTVVFKVSGRAATSVCSGWNTVGNVSSGGVDRSVT